MQLKERTLKRILIIGDSFGALERKNNFFTEEFYFGIHFTDNSQENYQAAWTDLLQDHHCKR